MAVARSSGMHIRVNQEIIANVEPILAAIGLPFSDVFNLTLNQIYILNAESFLSYHLTPICRHRRDIVIYFREGNRQTIRS